MAAKSPPHSPDVAVITLPAWFKDEAARYIAHSFAGEHEKGNTFEFSYSKPPDYLLSRELESVWSHAAKRFPDDPAKGQIELFLMIQASFPDPDDTWVTPPVAERWRKRTLQIIQQLEQHWLKIPANFTVDVGPPLDWVRADELHDELPGLERIKEFINQPGYQESPHGSQTVGEKAVVRYFKRVLSAQMKTTTGSWRRLDVATITSAIFGHDVEPHHVTRATRDLQPPTPKENQRWIRDILNPSEPDGDEYPDW